MKEKTPQILLLLIIFGLSYSLYLLDNTQDSKIVLEQSLKIIEKKKQVKEEGISEERKSELKLDSAWSKMS